MKLPYSNIMVDVESTDNIATGGIISIGAVAFNKNDVSTNQFYRAVTLESLVEHGYTFSKGTMAWWRKQSAEAQSVLFDKNAVSIDLSLREYNAWIQEVAGECLGMTKQWSCGASFDTPMLEVAYRKHGLQSPLKFYHSSCYRTAKNAHPKVKMVRESGTKASHNALQDALEQAKHLQAINQKAGGIYL